jgi:Spy/CpxP family protein refolding chaperone
MKMQNMFRGLFYVGIATALTLPALPTKAFPASAAQDVSGNGSKRMMRDRLQDAVSQLDLNDDQKGKLNDVFADSKSKREAIANDSSLTKDQKREKMKSLHEDTMSKVNQVLTPDQQKQLKDKLSAERSKNPS